jgi:hypothetical protein
VGLYLEEDTASGRVGNYSLPTKYFTFEMFCGQSEKISHAAAGEASVWDQAVNP